LELLEGLAGRVETTALVVQALSAFEDDQKLINRGLVFLLKQKDRYGVWYSTQATINVLEAMMALLSTNKVTGESQSIAEVVVNGRTVQTVTIPPSRELSGPIEVNLSKFLSVGKNRVEIKRPSGGPFASVQAVANYYVPWSDATEPKGDLRLLRILLSQLTTLHSFKDLQPLSFLCAHPQMSFHWPTLSGAHSGGLLYSVLWRAVLYSYHKLTTFVLTVPARWV